MFLNLGLMAFTETDISQIKNPKERKFYLSRYALDAQKFLHCKMTRKII